MNNCYIEKKTNNYLREEGKSEEYKNTVKDLQCKK